MEDITKIEVEETNGDEVGAAIVPKNETSNSSKMAVGIKLGDRDVRRTIISFGRCFCIGSIAGGALRNENDIQSILELERALNEFGTCTNSAEHGSNSVCSNCVTHLNDTGMRCDEYASSAARLSCAIAEGASFAVVNGLKYFLCVANVIQDAMAVHAKCFESFESSKRSDVTSYHDDHRYVDGISNLNRSN